MSVVQQEENNLISSRGMGEFEMTSEKPTNHKVQTKNPTLKSHVKEFAENTTAHGYGHVASSQPILLKSFWVIIIIICHVIITIQIIPLAQKFMKKPVITNVYIRREKNPSFPVIVICNNNIVREDKISSLKEQISQFYSNSTHKNSEVTYESINALIDKIGHQIFEYGHQFDDFVQECTWLDSEDCKKQGWISYWHHLYGSCFAFNSVKVPGKNVRNIGPINSLRLILNLQKEYYFRNLTRSAGVRIFVAKRGSYYLPHDKGYSLKAGNEYSIAFRKHEIIRAKDCLSNQKAKFYLHGHEFIAQYNSDICSQLCLANLMINKCDCVDARLPRISNSTKRCNALHKSCTNHVTRLFDEHGSDCDDKCLPSCKEVYFPIQISSMEFPLTSTNSSYHVSNHNENLLSLVLYYNTLNVRVTEDTFFYNVEDLLADIGGQLGLFSGYSVLTVVEFLVLLVTMMKLFSRKFFAHS